MDDNKFWIFVWIVLGIAACIGVTQVRGCINTDTDLDNKRVIEINKQNTERDKAMAAAGLIQKQDVNGVILWVKP